MLRLHVCIILYAVICCCGIHSAERFDAATDEVQQASNADTPVKIEASIDVMKRLFLGGNYAQTIAVGRELLANPYFSPIAPITRDKIDLSILSTQAASNIDNLYKQQQAERNKRQSQREMVYMHMARAVYEQALLKGDQSQVRTAIPLFKRIASNKYLFDHPQNQAEGWYWVGSAYFYLGEFSNAINSLRHVSNHRPEAELEVKASLLLADSLKSQADIVGESGTDRPGRSPSDLPENPAEVLKARNELLRDAEKELSKITANHPQSSEISNTRLRLIELRFQLHEYELAETLAREFMRRATPGSDGYAKAAYYQANSVYYQGRISESAELFRTALEENKNAPAAVKASIFMGYGWANIRLAQTTSPENRLVCLTRAQNSLRQAIALMPFGKDRQDAIMDLAPVLIRLGIYQDALKYLSEVINDPAYRVQANFLSGRAAMGLDAHEVASTYFHTVLQSPEQDRRIVLDTLMELAKLEESRQAYGEALEYYRIAVEQAQEQRQFDVVATASLGQAVAIAELGYYNEEARQESAQRLMRSILQLSAMSVEGNPTRLASALDVLSFRSGALGEWNNAGSGNLAKADQILQKLRGRLLPRLREDELEYVQGKVEYMHGLSLLKKLPVIYDSIISDYVDVFKYFDNSITILNNSLMANPRGALSPRTRLLLGKVYNSCAKLKVEIAELLRNRGMGAEAVKVQQEGLNYFEKAINPLSLALTDALDDVRLRIDARLLLGKVYLALGQYGEDSAKYEKGLEEFRILVGEPQISRPLRIAAIRDMATALSEKKRKDEAVKLLLPYADKDILSALKAGNILQELKEPRKAYQVLLEGIAAARRREDTNRDALSEAIFYAGSLGLFSADTIALSKSEVKTQQQVAVSQLLELSRNFPGTLWASRSLGEVGRWMLENHQWKQAFEFSQKASQALQTNSRAVDTLQALYILEGRAQLEGSKVTMNPELARDALLSFARAERANTRTELGRTQRARAVRLQGDAYLQLNNETEALKFYGRVFSIFYNEYSEADLARLAAAKIHASRGDYKLAIKILDGGFSKDILIQDKLIYENKLKSGGM